MSKYYKYASEIRPGTPVRTCGIKPNNYSSRISQILEMTAIAKQDFSFLEDKDIWVVSYDGERWKMQTGIEFQIPVSSSLPKGYHETSKLEDKFAGN